MPHLPTHDRTGLHPFLEPDTLQGVVNGNLEMYQRRTGYFPPVA